MRKLPLALVIAVSVVGVLSVGGVATALTLENQDPFCASCHTQPELTYYQRSAQKDPVDLASFHTQKNARCIDCHSGGGVFGRGEGLQQGAHDLITYALGTYHHPAVTMNPLGDDLCIKCHADVVQRSRRGGSRSTNGHYHFFLPRWQAVDSNAARCTTCHTAHSPHLASLQ